MPGVQGQNFGTAAIYIRGSREQCQPFTTENAVWYAGRKLWRGRLSIQLD
jgi:hypothetical protein